MNSAYSEMGDDPDDLALLERVVSIDEEILILLREREKCVNIMVDLPACFKEKCEIEGLEDLDYLERRYKSLKDSVSWIKKLAGV